MTVGREVVAVRLIFVVDDLAQATSGLLTRDDETAGETPEQHKVKPS